MKIGLTTTSFRQDQGAERFVINLAKGLLAAGEEVHVIGRLEKPDALEEFLDTIPADFHKRFKFHRVRTIKATKYLNIITFARAVHKVLKGLNPDIVQGFGKSLGLDVFRPPTGTQKAFLLETRDRPKLQPCTVQELALERQLLYNVSRAVVVNSRLSKNRLQRVYPELQTPVYVIPNMVQTTYWQTAESRKQGKELRHSWNLPDNGIVFLHASTAFNTKGVPEMLTAFAQLRRKLPEKEAARMRVVLVGDDSYTVPVPVQAAVSVYPRTDDIRPFFHAADVLIHPTRYDSYANVVLEAFACGLPVATTPFNGAIEAIDPGVDGLQIDSVSPQQISTVMEAFLAEDMRDRMKQAALRKSAQFSPEQITERYLSLYRKLLPTVQHEYGNLSVRPWEAFLNREIRREFNLHLRALKSS